MFVPDNDPLQFYRRIAQLGLDMLVPRGRLYFEINQAYGPETIELLSALNYKNVRLIKDLFGNNRMVTACTGLIGRNSCGFIEGIFRSEHSRADAYEILKKWGFDNKMIEGMLEALETGGFINDKRFSKSFISDKFRFNKWGRLKIAQALALRKIPAEGSYK